MIEPLHELRSSEEDTCIEFIRATTHSPPVQFPGKQWRVVIPSVIERLFGWLACPRQA